jgi:predicted nucleotidyltransferase
MYLCGDFELLKYPNMNIVFFEQICQLKRQILPSETVILFGSQARGDQNKDSDWDLLVLLDKDTKTSEDEDNLGYPFAKMGWAYGEDVNAILYTKSQWEESKITPFYQNVMQEGIEIK